jgi:hypothetical protein
MGGFCWNPPGDATGLAAVNGEGGFTMGATGVRVRTGLGSIGGSFQFSVVYLGGGGGKSAIRERAGLTGWAPGLYGLKGAAEYGDTWAALVVDGVYAETREVAGKGADGFAGPDAENELAGIAGAYGEAVNVFGWDEGA